MGMKKGTEHIKMERDLTPLSRALKRAREEAGLNQTQTAELAGLSKVMISRYETKKSVPTKDSLKALARVYAVSYAELEAIAQGRQEGDFVKVTPKPTLQSVIHALQELGSNLKDDDLEVLLAYVLIKSARRGEKKS